MTNTPLADHLRARRAMLDMTQQQVADLFNVSRAAVAIWEEGRRLPPSRLLPHLATWLEVDAAVLLSWIDCQTLSADMSSATEGGPPDGLGRTGDIS